MVRLVIKMTPTSVAVIAVAMCSILVIYPRNVGWLALGLMSGLGAFLVALVLRRIPRRRMWRWIWIAAAAVALVVPSLFSSQMSDVRGRPPLQTDIDIPVSHSIFVTLQEDDQSQYEQRLSFDVLDTAFSEVLERTSRSGGRIITATDVVDCIEQSLGESWHRQLGSDWHPTYVHSSAITPDSPAVWPLVTRHKISFATVASFDSCTHSPAGKDRLSYTLHFNDPSGAEVVLAAPKRSIFATDPPAASRSAITGNREQVTLVAMAPPRTVGANETESIEVELVTEWARSSLGYQLIALTAQGVMAVAVGTFGGIIIAITQERIGSALSRLADRLIETSRRRKGSGENDRPGYM